jgi:hypothetical protein
MSDDLVAADVAAENYRAGLVDGGVEAFASMVIHGQCQFMGRMLHVDFDWPTERFFDPEHPERGVVERRDERFYEQVWDICRATLQAAYEAGRQQHPPPDHADPE